VAQSRTKVRWLAAGAVPVVVLPLVAVAATGAHASPGADRVTLHGSAPRWVAGLASPSTTTSGAPVDVRVFLAPQGGQGALDAAVAAVSTPGDPQYRHFLTPEQYRQRFAPTDQAVDEVRSWLAANSFQVTGVEASHRYVSAHGDAAAARKAFGVSLRNFRRNGRTVQAPTSDATVPTSIAGLVTGVTGLDNEPQRVAPGAVTGDSAAPPPGGFVTA
jgi:subtilase family serine protease